MQPIDLTLQSALSLLQQIAAFLPSLLAALVLLLAGWLVARLARAGVGKLLGLIRFQRLTEQSGVEAFLRQGGVELSLAGLIAGLIYWLVLLVTVVMVANSLGLTVVADLFNRVVLYLPHVVAAIFVLVLGILVARLVNRGLFAFLTNAGFSAALTVSTLAEYAITLFVVFMALEQLQISTALLHAAFQIGFGAVAFALALAFGLGGRDWAAGVIQRVTAKPQRPDGQ